MAAQRPRKFIEPLSSRLGVFHQPSHLAELRRCQFHMARSPVLLQTRGFGCTRNGDESLRSHPRQRDLRDRAALPSCQLLDLIDDGFVLVKVLALELRDWKFFLSQSVSVRELAVSVGGRTGASEIIRGKVIGRLVVEDVHEPAVSQRAEGHKGYPQFLGRVDQATGLVHRLKRRVLGLHCIDLGD